MKTNQKGVTLLALVIIIIIMLILAGVTLNLTLGERGIFNTAQKAKETQKIAEYKEKVELSRGETALNNIGNVTLDNLIQKIYKDQVVPEGSIEKIDEERAKMTTTEGYVFVITADKIEHIPDGKIDTTPPTISTYMYSCLKTDFSKWSLDNEAYISDNTIILPKEASSAISDFYYVQGERWWVEGRYNSNTPRPGENKSAVYAAQIYYDIKKNEVIANSNGLSHNGWATSLEVNKWTYTTRFGCKDAPESGTGLMGWGKDVQYVRIKYATAVPYSYPTTMCKDIKFYTDAETSNYSKVIEVTVTDDNKIKTQKFLPGNKTVEDFANAGTEITGRIEVTSNGEYTIYAEDMAGNKTVKNITVSGITS